MMNIFDFLHIYLSTYMLYIQVYQHLFTKMTTSMLYNLIATK